MGDVFWSQGVKGRMAFVFSCLWELELAAPHRPSEPLGCLGNQVLYTLQFTLCSSAFL